MPPLVSIIIPAYNSEEWVGEAIESALAQTWPRKEIIVVDDGSTDSTLSVARRYESASVKVVTQPNAGASAARNHGLRQAQGDLIQWLDADDLLASDKVEQQLRSFDLRRDSRILLSSAWGYFYHRPHKAKFRSNSLWEDLPPLEWLLRRMSRNEWIAIETWLVSRGLTERAGPWDETLRRNNDGEYFCRVVCHSEGVRFVPTARSYVRRANPASISCSDIALSDTQLDAIFSSISKFIAHVRSLQDDERTRAASIALLQSSLPWFQTNERWDLVKASQEMARRLGGEVRLQRNSRLVALMEPLLGPTFTKQLRTLVQNSRFRAMVAWDRWLANREA